MSSTATTYQGARVEMSPAHELVITPRGGRPIRLDAATTAALLIMLIDLRPATTAALRAHMLGFGPHMAPIVEIAERAFVTAAD